MARYFLAFPGSFFSLLLAVKSGLRESHIPRNVIPFEFVNSIANCGIPSMKPETVHDAESTEIDVFLVAVVIVEPLEKLWNSRMKPVADQTNV